MDRWSDAMLAELRTLWDAGATASAIGYVLGVGKNAVIGKAHRLKLESRPSPVRRLSQEVRVAVAAAVSAGEKPETVARRLGVSKTYVYRAKSGKAAAGVAPPPLQLKIERRPPEGCRWPMSGFTARPTHQYCGAPRGDAASSYCATHQRKSCVEIKRCVSPGIRAA